MNSIMIIHPYKYEGFWVFDDAKVGLIQEPFVAGADVMLDRMTADIPNAAQGVTVLFSAHPFPGHQYEFIWRRGGDVCGDFYYCPAFDLEGWLCPALLKYFEQPPPKIFAQVKPRAG